MVILSRIYTKTGDKGTTSLGDGTIVPKTDSRIGALSAVDEVNSCIGVVLSLGGFLDPEVEEILERVQNDLFDVGADLCTPVVENPEHPPLRVVQSQIDYLEQKIDLLNTPLNPLRSFVLPAGTYPAAQLHMARTVARRAERAIWFAIEEHGDSVSILAAQYLNRLSDLLFVIARYLNRGTGDVMWIPGKNR